jgi:hypothetical protein
VCGIEISFLLLLYCPKCNPWRQKMNLDTSAGGNGEVL